MASKEMAAAEPEDQPLDQLAGSNSDDGRPEFLQTPEGRKLAYHKLEGTSKGPGVVYIHGLGSSMNGEKPLALEQFCRRQGKAFVRFDLSGHGQSSETFRSCLLTTWLEDLNCVIDSLTKGPQILVGSSIGGWLMFLYTMRNPERVSGLVGVAAAPDFTQYVWKRLDKDTKRQVRQCGVYHLPSPYSPDPYEFTMDLIHDGDKYSILDMPGIEYIKVPTWLLHGEQDEVVPVNTALKLMQRLQCPVTLKTVEDGEHRLSRPQDIELITQALGALLNPELEEATESED